MDPMGSQQQERGKAYSYCGECKAWHYNWWLRKYHGKCTCGHLLLTPKDETLKLVNDADLALKYRTKIGIDADTLELLQQKIASQATQGPPAARVAELALHATRVENQVTQAIKEYHRLHTTAEEKKSKVADLVQQGARLRPKLEIARQERGIGDATSSTQGAGTRAEPPFKSRNMAADDTHDAQQGVGGGGHHVNKQSKKRRRSKKRPRRAHECQRRRKRGKRKSSQQRKNDHYPYSE